jgi:hypothetical protein
VARGRKVAKRRAREKHAVKAELQVPGLSKAGSSLNLKIYASRSKLGEVTIGRGSLYRYGRCRQKRKRISWTRFAEMMDRLAYGK